MDPSDGAQASRSSRSKYLSGYQVQVVTQGHVYVHTSNIPAMTTCPNTHPKIEVPVMSTVALPSISYPWVGSESVPGGILLPLFLNNKTFYSFPLFPQLPFPLLLSIFFSFFHFARCLRQYYRQYKYKQKIRKQPNADADGAAWRQESLEVEAGARFI